MLCTQRLRSQSSSGPIYTSGLEAGLKPGFTFHPGHGAAAWGREDTCDGVQSQAWGPPCAPIHWQTQGPPVSPDFATQHKGVQDWVFFCLVFLLLLSFFLKLYNNANRQTKVNRKKAVTWPQLFLYLS